MTPKSAEAGNRHSVKRVVRVKRGARHWLLAQKLWIVPIPCTTKPNRLDENLGAAEITLTPADPCEIESAASKIHVLGARYPETLERMIGR